MFNVCLTGPGYTPEHIRQLEKQGCIVTWYSEPLSEQDLQTILPHMDAYVLGGDERLTAPLLAVATRLRLISFVGTGYTSFIDVQAAQNRAISIRSTPGVNAPAVAEHTIGLLLGLQRKLFQHHACIKQDQRYTESTHELSSKCIGIIGLGDIGSRIARILRLAFNSRVLYTSRTPKPQLEEELNITSVTQDTLLAQAEIIILALPTDTETEYFLHDEQLAKTKAGVIIINTAGARLIEPQALKKYLDQQHIAAAAFDGYYIEPLPKRADDPFHLLGYANERFIVTPHVAAKTQQSWSRMLDQSIENVIQFLREKDGRDPISEHKHPQEERV